MRPVFVLGVFILVAIALELLHVDNAVLVFGAAALAVIPLCRGDERGHGGDRR